eukprot:EG_transcript_27461
MSNPAADAARSLHEFFATDIDGKEVQLKDVCEGKLTMVVNVASRCGKTDTSYKAMTHLYNTYGPRGFTILAFPCNQFLWQEPGTPEMIKEFVRGGYGGRFPLFNLINVKGPDIHPVYRFLTRHLPGKIPWNFGAKFFCDRHGVPFKRFDQSNNWDEIEGFVDNYLSQNPSSRL